MSIRGSSIKTGRELDQIRRNMELSIDQFAYCLDISRSTMTRLLSGQMDGKLPFLIDIALALGQRDPTFWMQAPEGKNYRGPQPGRKRAKETTERKETAL